MRAELDGKTRCHVFDGSGHSYWQWTVFRAPAHAPYVTIHDYSGSVFWLVAVARDGTPLHGSPEGPWAALLDLARAAGLEV